MYKIFNKYYEFIIKVDLINTLNLEEIEPLLKDIYDHANEKRIYLLTDASKVSYNFSIKDLYFISEVIKKYIEKANVKVFEAMIINSPIETAIAFYLLELRNHSPKFMVKYETKIFYTEKAALNWLLINKFGINQLQIKSYSSAQQ
ncbi:MAG: hypothetical protein HXX16_07635 [Bacteroidales bacterium]|nr:hypothetical protein [Bacteroidales bacterium]